MPPLSPSLDAGGPKKWQLVLFSGAKKGKELEESDEKTNTFDNPTEVINLESDVEELKVVLNEKLLIGHSYKVTRRHFF